MLTDSFSSAEKDLCGWTSSHARTWREGGAGMGVRQQAGSVCACLGAGVAGWLDPCRQLQSSEEA